MIPLESYSVLTDSQLTGTGKVVLEESMFGDSVSATLMKPINKG